MHQMFGLIINHSHLYQVIIFGIKYALQKIMLCTYNSVSEISLIFNIYLYLRTNYKLKNEHCNIRQKISSSLKFGSVPVNEKKNRNCRKES